MEHRPVLGSVDFLPAEHGMDFISQVGLLRQFYQQFHRLFGDAVLGVIKQDFIEPQREALEPLGIASKEISHVDTGYFLLVLDQCLPG